MPPKPNHDPITGRSMSGLILLVTALLVLSTFWALYDEFFGMRPWKAYQARFAGKYSRLLQEKLGEQKKTEEDVRNSAAFQKLEQQVREAEEAAAPQVSEIDREVRDIDRRIAVLRDAFQIARGEVTALIYQVEVASSEQAKEKLSAEVEEVKQHPVEVELPVPDGTTENRSFTYDELESEYDRLKERKAELIAQRVHLLKPANELRAQRDTYLEDNLVGLSPQALEGILRRLNDFPVEIKQIHVKEADLVERCESCHLGTREPLLITAADMGGERVFASHPNGELLALHDPERFGCSPCHNGNGRATASVVKGHGRHKYWLWPLYHPENTEAGCQQCHVSDFVLDHAETLNRGKELFRLRGCIGCHRYEGFDNQNELLVNVQKELQQLADRRKESELEAERSIQTGDRAETNQEAQRLYQRAENLRVRASNLDAQTDQLQRRSGDLLREIKKVGPNLKEIRVKLQPRWIPVWLQDPHAWRPTTKMPRFRLQDDEVQAISAFLWQNAIQARLPRQPRGNAARGKELFETRGCMACHSMGEGENQVGGTFAANLSRVGEKANYDYLVRWIHNPRERTQPYCPFEKRDLTPADYARHGLPFEFDLDHATCPNDGHQLQVQQMTVMPSLRLTWQDTRDIATYLITQRRQGPNDYAAADFLEDNSLFETGKSLVRHYGCAGCHEIAGFEQEGRIGTELTLEGSKPIERLDFALLTHEAERDDWYNHKGFFEYKLADPAVFDQGKVREPEERLRMPKPNLAPDDIDALTTFLLGSVNPTVPEQFRYNPDDRRKDIQDGWWVVTKYNCMGCHQIRIGKPSVLMTLPRYQDPDWKEQLPPILVGAGARLNPDWLAQFLANPALSESNLNRNGVRTYLRARMPTFNFSPGEIRKLVRFFQASSSQPLPYVPPKIEPLSDRERTLARQLFTHPAAPCLRCHATGDAAHDRTANAPNFLTAPERLKPDWTRRWLLDPARISPGTAMPSGLFRQEGERWVFAGPLPPAFRNYSGDHADLLVRYMFQITPAEQRLLLSRMARASSPPTVGLAANLLKSH